MNKVFQYFLIVCVTATNSHSIVEEWKCDLDQRRPMSTWNWIPAFAPQSPPIVPEFLSTMATDRSLYMAIHKEYETSGFDHDLLLGKLKEAPFQTEAYKNLHQRLKKPLKIYDRKVSFVCPTHRPHDLELILENFSHQTGVECELVLIPNGIDYDLRLVQERIDAFFKGHPDKEGKIKIIDLPSKTSLGEMLNIGTQSATHDVIARLDGDDLYGRTYLLNMFKEGLDITEASLYGKPAVTFVLTDQGIHMNPRRYLQIMNYCSHASGGTHIGPKSIFTTLKHEPINLAEDVHFCKKILKSGGSIFSTDLFNTCVLRNKNSEWHTWKTKPGHTKLYRKIGNWSHIPCILNTPYEPSL